MTIVKGVAKKKGTSHCYMLLIDQFKKIMLFYVLFLREVGPVGENSDFAHHDTKCGREFGKVFK